MIDIRTVITNTARAADDYTKTRQRNNSIISLIK